MSERAGTKQRKVSRAGLLALALILLGLIVVLVVGASLRDDGSASGDATAPAPVAVQSFNSPGLPPVHIDRCPSAGELLPAPVTGSDTLPDLSLECIGEIGSTDSVPLRRLGGVPTVVNLWSTSCEPCRREMPDLERIHQASAGRVRILGVNSKDYAEGARATINLLRVTFPSLADPDERVRLAVGSFAMPTTIFIGADGRIVHRKVGQFADEESLRADIAKHLGVRL